MSLGDFAPFANHVWQSTLFVAAVWLLALVLKKHHAQVRHWLWLAASIKFLVPFAALAAIGSEIRWWSAADLLQSPVPFVIDAISQPFSQPEFHTVSGLAPGIVTLPIFILAVWIGGCALSVLAWVVRWRQFADVVQHASPVHAGRELDALRRLERLIGIRHPVTLVSSTIALEPGVFGMLKPVLVWPRRLGERLTDPELDAILAHEVCHVRRRDNLTIAIHLVVEGLFWFHPAVWWLEHRLVDERVRACDEEVVRLGSDPQVYAESILKTCEWSIEPPVIVAGVAGSDLRQRIEAIVKHETTASLTPWRARLLTTSAIVTIVGPVAVGAVTSPRPLRTAQASSAGSRQPSGATDTLTGPAFGIASIKPNTLSRDDNMAMQQQPGGGFTATNVTLRLLVQHAYHLQDFQVVEGPSWMNAERFDIVAKADDYPQFIPPPELQLMLRRLLAERFKLTVRNETRDLRLFALLAARDRTLGPRLLPATVSCAPGVPPPTPDSWCGLKVRPSRIMGRGITIGALASGLSSSVGRVVLDRTGLIGDFDLDLEWAPGANNRPATDASSIVTAVRDQLGLALDTQRGPYDVLVIGRVQRPTSD
ncbi:MAG: hypothetical protein DMF89_22045 [Acidobacteria bacterium]|nr:MAG: hypothetical protein DMF89_22045 [Acidobacteriota bacterium]